MPRPFKNRCVTGRPNSVVYKPAGIPARVLQWVTLGLDEFEAIRLLDYQQMDQQKAAELMHVSRPTVARIYASARKKIAEALTEGKAINIEGGPIAITSGPQASNGQHGGFGCGGRRHRGGRNR